MTGLHVIRKNFEGTDLANLASSKIAELKKDAEFQTELKASRIFGGITGLEDTLTRARESESTTSASFRKRNYAALSTMRKGVVMLQKKYPDAKATLYALSIGEKYALFKK
jgi:hypothetical protein